MTAESLWTLFVRTGLPEAYSLYHKTISETPEIPYDMPTPADHDAAHDTETNIPGT